MVEPRGGEEERGGDDVVLRAHLAPRVQKPSTRTYVPRERVPRRVGARFGVGVGKRSRGRASGTNRKGVGANRQRRRRDVARVHRFAGDDARRRHRARRRQRRAIGRVHIAPRAVSAARSNADRGVRTDQAPDATEAPDDPPRPPARSLFARARCAAAKPPANTRRRTRSRARPGRSRRRRDTSRNSTPRRDIRDTARRRLVRERNTGDTRRGRVRGEASRRGPSDARRVAGSKRTRREHADARACRRARFGVGRERGSGRGGEGIRVGGGGRRRGRRATSAMVFVRRLRLECLEASSRDVSGSSGRVACLGDRRRRVSRRRGRLGRGRALVARRFVGARARTRDGSALSAASQSPWARRRRWVTRVRREWYGGGEAEERGGAIRAERRDEVASIGRGAEGVVVRSDRDVVRADDERGVRLALQPPRGRRALPAGTARVHELVHRAGKPRRGLSARDASRAASRASFASTTRRTSAGDKSARTPSMLPSARRRHTHDATRASRGSAWTSTLVTRRRASRGGDTAASPESHGSTCSSRGTSGTSVLSVDYNVVHETRAHPVASPLTQSSSRSPLDRLLRGDRSPAFTFPL